MSGYLKALSIPLSFCFSSFISAAIFCSCSPKVISTIQPGITFTVTINQSTSGKAPTFQIRITPELKIQFEAAAKQQGMSLGNWLKTLGRQELERINSGKD
ncbi:hypothetical protein FHR25_004231 [Yokenella regensburgei]|nr:hypothetical protein FHR25_004231 [Yokenella regensburgei]